MSKRTHSPPSSYATFASLRPDSASRVSGKCTPETSTWPAVPAVANNVDLLRFLSGDVTGAIAAAKRRKALEEEDEEVAVLNCDGFVESDDHWAAVEQEEQYDL